MKKRVVFVCMGNICRSPTGEGVLKKRLIDRGLADAIEVDSAGTIGYHTGERADSRMRAAAEPRGYRLESRARQFQREDFGRFDLIVAMDQANRRDILTLAKSEAERARVRLLSEFLPADAPRDVPDPYYGGAAGFEMVIDMIEQAADPIIAALIDK